MRKKICFLCIISVFACFACTDENTKDDDGNEALQGIYQDNFENGISFELAENGFKWEGKVDVNIATDPFEPSNKVAGFTFGGDVEENDDSFSELRFKMDRLYQELWIRYRLYVPENYYHRDAEGSDNNKGYIMLWSGEYNNECNILVANSWWPLADGGTKSMGQWKTNTNTSRHYNEETYSGISIDQSADLGKWQDIVIHVKVADFELKNNGILQIWKNGTLINSHIDIDNYSRDGILNGIDQGYILGWSNSGFAEDTLLLVDDFAIGETAASIGFKN